MVSGIAYWGLVGGAAASLFALGREKTAKRRGAGGGEAEADQPPESPRTPRSSSDQITGPAAAWLIAQGSPSSDIHPPQEPREGVVAAHAQLRRHQLTEGSLVCFYSQGRLLVAKQTGSHWSLRPVPLGYHQEEGSLSYFPASSLFYVVKQGSSVGFKSFSAGGFLLQAVQSDAPHRLSNQNFGSWERWHLSADGFFNEKWGKALGLEIKELRCVMVEDMRRFERRHVKDKAALMDQIQGLADEVRSLRDRAAALESSAADSLSWSRNLQREYGSLKSRASLTKADLIQKTSLVSHLEARLSDAAAERSELLVVLEEAEGRNSGLETSMRELRAAAGREKFKEQQAHKRALEAALAESRQKDEELAHFKETAEERLDEIAEQLRAVCEERDRMDSALQSICGLTKATAEAEDSNAPDAPGPLRELRALLMAEYRGQQSASPASSLPEEGMNETREQAADCAERVTPSKGVDGHSPPSVSQHEDLDVSPSCQSEQTHQSSASRHVPPFPGPGQGKKSKNGFLELFAPALSGPDKLMDLLDSGGQTSPSGSESSVATPRVVTAAEFRLMANRA